LKIEQDKPKPSIGADFSQRTSTAPQLPQMAGDQALTRLPADFTHLKQFHLIGERSDSLENESPPGLQPDSAASTAVSRVNWV
jgi:hypothetical protein